MRELDYVMLNHMRNIMGDFVKVTQQDNKIIVEKAY
jgi:hypothetical protein